MKRRRPTALIATGALLLSACSPTDAGRPVMVGPDEVLGFWQDYQIVCTVPLTLSTPFPIVIIGGGVRVVFPAEGEPKAAVEHEFSRQEVEELWGPSLRDTTTRSVEINPLVQNEDYEATLSFDYESTRGEGSVRHVVKCRADGDPHA